MNPRTKKEENVRSDARIPRACKLASSRREKLVLDFESAVERLTDAECTAVLRSFQTILARGRVAINMSIPNLKRFLSTGKWLNIYEAVAYDAVTKKEKMSAADLEREISRRLKQFAQPRLKIDSLFKFRKDTHYSYLSLGGSGIQEFGICSVVLDIRQWSSNYTCFSGDTILSCFGWRGRRRWSLSDREILQGFALGKDWELLAVIKYEQILAGQKFCIDPRWVRNVVESDDPFEFHLHGSVKRDSVVEVLLPRRAYDQLCVRVFEAKSAKNLDVKKYDNVAPFSDVLRLLELYKIPLVIAE